MTELKMGDKVWTGPLEIARLSESTPGAFVYEGCCDQRYVVVDHIIPDHPALPKLAEWLQKHPGDLDHLCTLLVEAMPNMSNPDHLRVAYSFAYAIERVCAITPDAPETEGDR